jgi:hypothetical protein
MLICYKKTSAGNKFVVKVNKCLLPVTEYHGQVAGTQEVPCSNLGLVTGSYWFVSVPRGECLGMPQIRPRPLPPTALPTQCYRATDLPCALPQQPVAHAHSVASPARRARLCGPPPSRPPAHASRRGASACVTSLRQHGTGSGSCPYHEHRR